MTNVSPLPGKFTSLASEQGGAAEARQRDVRATPFRWPPAASLPTRDWIYGTSLIRGFVSALIAPGGVGKSAYTRTMSLALATGRPLMGDRVPKPASVWLYNLEDPLEEVERGLVATGLHYGIGPADCTGSLFVDSGRDRPVCLAETTREGVKIAVPVVEDIVAEMKARRIDVLIIDPFVSSHNVAENDNGQIDRVVKQWAMIAERTKASILLVHHTRKTGGQEITAEDARGGSAIIGAVRSARVLNRMTKEQASKAGVEHEWAYVNVTDGKSNLAPPASEGRWFRLESVGLGNGAGLVPEDRLGVAVPWEWPDAFADVTVHDLRRVQDKIAAGRFRADPQAKNWAGIAVAEALGLDPAEPSAKAKIGQLLKTWIASGALHKVTAEDENRRERPFIEVGELAS